MKSDTQIAPAAPRTPHGWLPVLALAVTHAGSPSEGAADAAEGSVADADGAPVPPPLPVPDALDPADVAVHADSVAVSRAPTSRTPRTGARGRSRRATVDRLGIPDTFTSRVNYPARVRCLRLNDDVDGNLRQGPLLRLFTIAQQTGRLMQVAMADSPLEPPDFAVYSWLRLVGPVTPTRLAADLGMRQPTLSNYLKRMTDRGHLRRRRNPLDGRSQLVSLTASGRRVTERSFPGFTAAISTFRAHLDVPEEELARVLGSLSDSLDRAVGELEQAALREETGS